MQRRTLIKGLAATLSLPTFESLGQIAHTTEIIKGSSPTRLAYVYIPNGVNIEHWRPKGSGFHYTLGQSMAALEPFIKDVQFIGNLDHDKAKANGDGAGDHARANATFLTGCQARKTSGKNIKLGVSVDQIAAAELGQHTRIPSLELSTDPTRTSGRCDSGYSCAYQYNLSWLDESTPLPAERHPRRVFEKLFGSGNLRQDAKRRAYQQSILDFVLQETKAIDRKLASSDKDKLDAYMTAVREVEKQIQSAEKHAVKRPDTSNIPSSIPKSFKKHVCIMYDMMALAFQTDTTRIVTFMLAHDGSNRAFPEIGVKNGHHSISHHKKNPTKLAQIAKIDTFYAEQFAYFLKKLKETQDGFGTTLLDSSMIVYGSGIADGDRHNHDNLPIILAGHGGKLKPGRSTMATLGTPMCNLHLSLLEKMGVEARRIGDSTGIYRGI